MSKRIVWVDDEHAKIALIVKPLYTAGYKLTRYRTYGDVLDHLDDVRQADLLIIDLIIPPGHAEVEGRYLGLDLLKKLRELDVRQPIIVMSVVSRSSVCKEIEQIPGIVDFVDKTSAEPIEEELLEIVRRTIGS